MGRRNENDPSQLRDIARMVWLETTPFVRRRLAGVCALVISAGALTALGPVALKFMVDRLTAQSGQGSGISVTLVTLYVSALWFARMANEVRELVFARARERIFRTLSERLFSHLMQLPLRFHLDRRTGAISQTLDNGVEGLRIILHHLLFTYLPVTVELMTVLLVIVRLVTTPFLFLFCGALACYAVAFGYSAASISKSARRASAARVDATAAMVDCLLNYEAVKHFTAESLVQERVARVLGCCELEWVSFYRRYARNGIMVAFIFAGFLTGTIFYGIGEVHRRVMTLGGFVLINAYMLQVVRPVEMMGYATQALLRGMAMQEKLVQLFREPPESGLCSGKDEFVGPGSLEFQNVCLSYDGDRPVLNEVSFRVGAGLTLGIVGPSGSGKSTIVRLLMRMMEPASGRILLDGMPITGLPLEDLRRAIAVVPQDTVLFDDTMRYNIAFGRAGASAEDIEEAAKIAQLHETIMALPNGYDTFVGERGVKLSGGERQRVAIARAVLKSPRIYIFDEATSSLDSRTECEILRNLRSISRSHTTLVIAHRLSTVVHADETVVLESGQIVEHGTHQSLIRRSGRYAALWKAQHSGAAAA